MQRKLCPALAFVFALVALGAPPRAAEPQPAAAAPAAGEALTEEQFLDLVSAYQGSYFQLAAVAAFQVYSACGLVESSFRAGLVDAPQASGLLGQNSLLHSVCYSTLSKLRSLTPPDDMVALGEMDRLASILEAEQKLLEALDDFFARPGEAAGAAADRARAELEARLEAFAGAVDGGAGP